MNATTSAEIIGTFTDEVLAVLYGVIPEVLTGVAVLLGIFIGIRVATRLIRKFSNG